MSCVNLHKILLLHFMYLINDYFLDHLNVEILDKKVGVLLVNLGTPDEPTRGAVYKYLKQFLLDPRVIDYSWLPRNLLVRGIIAPFRSGSSAKLYKQLWTENGSPIKFYGEQLLHGVSDRLPDNYYVELAMRYQSPSIESALESLKNKLIDIIVVFPLFPQYASATTGSIHEEVMRIVSKWQIIPELKFVNSYSTNKKMIDIFIQNAREYKLEDYDHFLFSFHGLPQRQLKKGDITKSHCQVKKNCCTIQCPENKHCYSAQCHLTSDAIARKLGIPAEKFTVCFQSRLGPEAWAQPYTSKVIEEQRNEGAKRILVFSPAFVADCLETIIEIGVEYREEFIEEGGERLDLVKSLNNDPAWMDAVSEMIVEFS